MRLSTRQVRPVYFPQDDILHRVDERNAMAGLAERENHIVPNQNEKYDAEVPDAINEIEIEMVVIDAPQQVPQVVQNAAANDEPQFEIADENAETEQQHQVPQIEQDNAAGNVQPSEENSKADDPPVEPVVNDPPPVQPVVNDSPVEQNHGVMPLIRQCFVSIPKIRTELGYQPYPFRRPRQGPQERNVRVKCAVCHRIFRINNVPFDFDVEGNICSKECALRL